MTACDRLRAYPLRTVSPDVGEDMLNRIGDRVRTSRGLRLRGSHRSAQYRHNNGVADRAHNRTMHGRKYNSCQLEVRTRGRLTAGAKLVIALYVAAFAALPFAHHDFLCHVRSSTHCDVCHVGTSADNSSGHSALTQVQLEDAGCAFETVADSVSSVVVIRSSGRSPPSAIVSL